MAKFKPQFKRLQFIHSQLQKGKFPNCRTLAEEWETSPKTIQRDIQFLKDEQNAPIEYDATEHGYYYTDKTYDLPALRISEGDLFALAIAEKALAAYRNTPLFDRLLSVFAKIQETLPEKVSVHPSWIDAKFSVMQAPATRIDPAIWEILAKALRSERVLRIDHVAPGCKEATVREVEPYHMMNHYGEWYLIGFDRSRGQVRTFAVSRIRCAEILDEDFSVDNDFDVESYMKSHFGVWSGEKPHTVRIWFSPEVAPLIKERDWHPSQKIRENRDGSIVLSLRVAHFFEVKQWALSWGGDATVLAPQELREDVKRETRRAVHRYVQ